MSYDDLKTERGAEFVEQIEVYFNGCKHAVAPYDGVNAFFKTGPGHSASAVNFTLTRGPQDTGYYAKWMSYPSANLYLESNNLELMKVTLTGPTSILVTARGQFGTTPVAIPDGVARFRLVHKGEADGSCRGYSQTCSDETAYDPNVFRVVKLCTAPLVGGSEIIEGLHHKSVDYESAEADIGESIGSPARLKFKLQDIEQKDGALVPYPERRASAGTFWGRTLARNPYPNGRKVVYKSGLRSYGTYTEPEWVERHFIIDDISRSDGYVNFTCLDPVILTEDKKAKMPVASPAQLSAAITGLPANFNYVNAPDFYFGPLSATIFIRIDSEVIRCTVSGAKQLTISQRGYKSEIKDHEAGATVQDCVRFSGVHIIDAIVYALENYTTIPASFIGNYTAVKALIPTVDLDETIIQKPTAVADFISDMIKIGNLIFHFDESSLKFVIDYIPEMDVEPITISPKGEILRDSVTITPNTKEQYTRAAHLWGPVDITKDNDENFAINYLAVNTDVESPENMGEVNEKKAFKNPYLTTSAGDSIIATAYSARIAARADKKPQIITARVNAANIGPTQGGTLKIGSIVSVATKDDQNIDGVSQADLYQVVKMSGNAYENFIVKMRRYLSVQPASVSFVITTGGVNYRLSDHFAPAAGHYTIYIEQGVTFGSYSTAVAAFSTGTQAAGVSFTIINRGAMLGMGGAGGDAGIDVDPAKTGSPGGVAFEATVPCTIDTGAGLIWAGGSGGSGEIYINPQGPTPFYVPRRGGGGGQGYGASLGGLNTDGIDFTDYAESGNQSGPGSVNCPDGGEWGSVGEAANGLAPALAGEAIKSNGYNVIISAGNNDVNIRGRRT